MWPKSLEQVHSLDSKHLTVQHEEAWGISKLSDVLFNYFISKWRDMRALANYGSITLNSHIYSLDVNLSCLALTLYALSCKIYSMFKSKVDNIYITYLQIQQL